MTFINPGDLSQILVVNFAGTVEIFVFIISVLIAGMSARFRMPGVLAAIMYVIFITLMMSTYLAGAFTGIYVISIVLVCFFVFFVVSSKFR